ncbi:MAG: alanine racemase, partial [Desulfobacteraceae bacterium]|nr:alanine racemase [Desulfobacteraceae bacterium]
AEVMEANGIKDVMIANEIIGKKKIQRLINLGRLIEISSLVDSIEGATMLSKAASKEGVTIKVYLDIDIGMNRCGVSPGESAVHLAKSINSLPSLNFVGILGFRSVFFKGLSQYTPDDIWELGMEEGKILVQNAQMIREAGIPISEVVAGSTPTAESAATVSGVTEVQPGTYVFNDVMQASVGACRLEDCSVSVITTVISKPAENRAIIDAGNKTLVGNCGSDCFPSLIEGHGLVKEREGVILKGFFEEQGVLLLDPAKSDVKIGDRLEIIPNHICPIVNMFDEIVGLRDRKAEVVWPILARGKVT